MKGKLYVPNNSTLCASEASSTTTATGEATTSEAVDSLLLVWSHIH